MKVKEESEKYGLKLNIQKTKIMASSPIIANAAAKSLQSCPTLCDPIDGSPPGSPTPGILQARTLEWVAISFSNAWKWKVKVKSLNRVWLLLTPWTTAYQAPPSMGFFRRQLMANRWGQNGNSGRFYFLGLQNPWTVTAAIKLNEACSLEEKL